ncbi:MAG TPA: hypothetical protein VF669_05575 [Tepidisphaeraceae bacterium]|jgi:hypothetical protein
MLMLDKSLVRQRLFTAQAADGAKLCLAFLFNGGCAILRNDEIVQSWDNDTVALDLALDRFTELMGDRIEKR